MCRMEIDLSGQAIVLQEGIEDEENVLVGNDCGFASVAGNTEIQITVAWAKLASLGEGAKIASTRLWS